MAEAVELLHTFDAEDEEIDDEADHWPLPCVAPPAFGSELHHRRDRSFHLDHGGGGELPALDPTIFVPVFSPHIHHFSSGRLDHQIPSDSDSESSYVDDRVTLALDLLERSSPRRESGGGSGGGGTQTDPFFNSVDPLCVGVLDAVEDMGSDYLELGLGLGLEFGLEKSKEEEEGGAGVNLEEDECLDLGGDGFFVGGRSMVRASGGADGEPSGSREGEGLRIVPFGSDSDSDEEDEMASRMRPHSDGGDVPDRMFDDLGLPLCWDCVRIDEDRRDPNECFDWEEVDGRVNDREVLSTVIDDDDSSIAPEEESTDLELEEGEEGTVPNVEWEVLLAMNNLDRNVPVEHEDAESYLGEEHNDYVYTSEYEILFDQFADHENFIKGGPPAAELVIERLPSVVLTQLDVANNNTLCAVCKDEISLEEKAKRLPCSHHYHASCILPWLRIRNTCPVCRYELPTDDPNYENWRAWRAGSGVAAQGSQVRYDFGVFPEE